VAKPAHSARPVCPAPSTRPIANTRPIASPAALVLPRARSEYEALSDLYDEDGGSSLETIPPANILPI